MTTEIKAGSYIKIPKGTLVHQYGKVDKITKRDSVAQVTQIYEQYDWEDGFRIELPTEVRWSENNKSTLLSNVEPAEAPAPHKVDEVKAKEPTLRQRMVKGTKWKLTQDAQVTKEKRVPVKYPNGRMGYNSETELDFIVPAGTEIEIAGKASSYSPWYSSGVWLPVVAKGYAKGFYIEYKELNKKPEQIGEAEVIPMFAIWDTAKKQYYVGYDYGAYDYATRTRNGDGLAYTDKLAKSKKFKRLADVRVHALIQTGYYDDLPESWDSVPEWMCGRKLFDVPDTWEIVKYDKLTKKEIERIELVDTFKRSWRLRELTVKYSSAVRKVYGDLEKKKKLNDWSAIMMFKKKNESNWGYWTEELTQKEIEEINELLGRFGDEVKIQKGHSGFAVAIKDAMTATMIRLAYQGDLECAIIDFTTMKEVVAE